MPPWTIGTVVGVSYGSFDGSLQLGRVITFDAQGACQLCIERHGGGVDRDIPRRRRISILWSSMKE